MYYEHWQKRFRFCIFAPGIRLANPPPEHVRILGQLSTQQGRRTAVRRPSAARATQHSARRPTRPPARPPALCTPDACSSQPAHFALWQRSAVAVLADDDLTMITYPWLHESVNLV